MRIFSITLVVLTLFSPQSGLASGPDGVPLERRANIYLPACEDAFANALFGAPQRMQEDLEGVLKVCGLSSERSHPIRTGITDAITSFALKVAEKLATKGFTSKERFQCAGLWEKDWHNARQAVKHNASWSILNGHQIQDPGREASDALRQIYHSARLEREFTLLLEKRNEPIQPNDDHCYNPWLAVLFARSVNAYHAQGFIAAWSETPRPLEPNALAAIWLIIQHADTLPEFRQSGLRFFKEPLLVQSLKGDLHARYLKTLEKRIAIVRQ